MSRIPCLVAILLAIAVTPSEAISARHATSRRIVVSRRFTFAPWRMTTGRGGRLLALPRPLPGGDPIGDLTHEFAWAPRPDRKWRPAPDIRTIGFDRTTGAACDQQIDYWYFRTSIFVPRRVARRTTRLDFGHVDDGVRIFVNGRAVPFGAITPGPIVSSRIARIGPYLLPGRNRIVVLLADWCNIAALQGARFSGETNRGETICAVLPTDSAASSANVAAPRVESSESRKRKSALIRAPTLAPGFARRLRFPPSLPPKISGFVFAPWEMTTPPGGAWVPVPPLVSSDQLRRVVFKWTPRPDSHWVAAPNPATLGFDRQTGVPPEKDIAYFYFRTTLNAPSSIRLRSVHVVFGHVDDSERLVVNGREVRDVPTWSYDAPIGRYLHRGRNSIVALVGDWSQEATLQGVRFKALTTEGKDIEAMMRSGARRVKSPRR